MPDSPHIAIIGAGAAGLMAATFAGRALRERGIHASVVALDGARTLGAKILVAGGGRCNVTHHEVDEKQYAGSTAPAIKNILRRFDVPQTIAFFRDQGVELKQEDTGKLFPVTDDARTVLDALLRAAADAGVRIIHPYRIAAVTRPASGGFLLHRADITGSREESIRAGAVILATGGKSLPKSGSDGIGHAIARSLGHSITPRVFPSLVPLVVDGARHALKDLSGIAVPATVEVRAGTGKPLKRFTNSILITHFGYSGPGILDISRYYLDARADDPRTAFILNWIPAMTVEALDATLTTLGKVSPGRFLAERLPERLAKALCAIAGVDPSASAHTLTRDVRKRLAQTVCAMDVPIAADRGWNYAEVTAGGVPLAELNIKTMESRICPGLFLCGEICDVDGRIGGFNFQWAWASGHVAGHTVGMRWGM
jgi:predicted Rossmann fold flavoprotein